MPIGRERILIQSLLGGAAPAPAVASIVEEKDREAAVMEFGQILEPMDDIAGVAVAPEKHRSRRCGWDKPAEQLSPVGGLK